MSKGSEVTSERLVSRFHKISTETFAHRGAESKQKKPMVTTRSMDEQQNTKDLIPQMQAQIQAQTRTIQAHLMLLLAYLNIRLTAI